jgi:hypothetical protein
MKHILQLAAAILVTPFLATHGALAADSGSSICNRSADTMKNSCNFEVNEEYQATVASCINFSDPGERADCLSEAKATRIEDREGCRAQRNARRDVCALLQEDRYDPDPLTDPTIAFVDPDTIGDSTMLNPYFSLQAGTTQVLRAGEGFEETIVVHVTDDVREIQGVGCRIVVDIVVLAEDDGEGGVAYEAVEVTNDYYAQAKITNDVYYCGELAQNFEDGQLINLDGSFEAGRDFAKAGILIKANPWAGDAHRQEWLLGEAEDVIQYVGVNETPTREEGGDNPNDAFSCSLNGGCVKTEEFIPPDPESGEFKYFLAGTGFVLGVGLENGEITGERDELVCIGDSLDILDDPSCGIEDVDRLMEELCRLSPDALCAD